MHIEEYKQMFHGAHTQYMEAIARCGYLPGSVITGARLFYEQCSDMIEIRFGPEFLGFEIAAALEEAMERYDTIGSVVEEQEAKYRDAHTCADNAAEEETRERFMLDARCYLGDVQRYKGELKAIESLIQSHLGHLHAAAASAEVGLEHFGVEVGLRKERRPARPASGAKLALVQGARGGGEEE